MKKTIIIFCLTIILSSCTKSQEKDNFRLIGGPCEGCEAVFEYGDKNLNSSDTLPGFFENGEKLRITGIVFNNDGKTPAGNVVLYIYHTNQKGIYARKENSTGWENRHGYMRGWIKTEDDGKYSFYTVRPANYPNRTEPAHIHAIILEPDGRYYWIADYYFTDDPLLNDRERNHESPRGGSGVMELRTEGDLITGERNIILGKNINGYK